MGLAIRSFGFLLVLLAPFPGKAGDTFPIFFSERSNFPELSGYIVDTAGLLSGYEAAELSKGLANLEAQTGVKIVLATLNSTNDLPIEDYGEKLASFWNLRDGKSLLLVVSAEDRNAHIEVGAQGASVFSSERMNALLSKKILPEIKRGDYGKGIKVGLIELMYASSGGQGNATIGESPLKCSYTQGSVDRNYLGNPTVEGFLAPRNPPRIECTVLVDEVTFDGYVLNRGNCQTGSLDAIMNQAFRFGEQFTLLTGGCNVIEWTITVSGQDWTWRH